MRIDGEWRLCDDGWVRPVFEGLVRAHDGTFIQVPFLADTGADGTVFSADAWHALNLAPDTDVIRVEGLGGRASSSVVKTDIKLISQSGRPFTFKGRFAAITDRVALDMSVLGRDITNRFALIVDRPQDVVCLIGQGHKYDITPG
jgi:Aspartyl protease